jgi:DNA repair protein RadD
MLTFHKNISGIFNMAKLPILAEPTEDLLFDYQRECVNNAIAHLKKSKESQVLTLPTAAGKSHICAEIARIYFEMSGKKCLCIAPSGMLVMQNSEKYEALGLDASIFSASLDKRSLRENVVFGTPKTVLNSIERVKKENFGLVICDEAHGITPTIKTIIDKLTEVNENLRLIGLTASPYRRITGYIYEAHYQLGFMEEAIEPYYKICTFEISGEELLRRGRITRPVIGKTSLKYETEKLIVKNGKFTDESIHQVFDGRGRLTADIVRDVVETAAPYAGGVLFFCATIQHTMEVLESLPPEHSAFTVGDESIQPKKERKEIERRFKEGTLRYLANVGTQTTGADFKQCVVIALLRQSDSVSLLQQMIGRGMRIFPGKEFFIVLDYAGNMEKHFPGGNIFQPIITAKKPNELERIPASCPECGHNNSFAMRPNDAGHNIDEHGYWTWADTGNQVQNADGEPIPGHLGRRCFGVLRNLTRCNYRWTFKPCVDEKCGHENDIAARYCAACKAELIDPNDKLELEGGKQGSIMVEPVMSIELGERIAKSGTKLKEITIKTAMRKTIKLFLRMSIETEREQFRLCRSMVDQDCSVEFKPDGKYWKFLGLTEIKAWEQ